MPPVNDNVVDAIQLTLPSTASGDTTGATAEDAAEIAWHGFAMPTTWYYVENATASDINVNVNNCIAVSGWSGGGIELDLWRYNGAAPDFATLDAFEGWQAYVASTDRPTFTQSATLTIPAGWRLYIKVGNFNWNNTDVGTFTFDVQSSVAASNRDFDTALALTGTSGHVHQAFADLISPDYYWYKIIPPDNPNGGTLTLKNSASNFYNVYAAVISTSLDSISPSTGTGIDNSTGATFIVYGIGLFFRIEGTFAGIVDFDWEWAPFPAAAIPVAASPGTEVRSPSASHTAYPGGAVAVRVTDFVAGGSIGSDSGAPNGNYISDTQNITPSYANYFSSTTAASMSDTIVIDLNTIGLETGVQYNVFYLCKAEGTTPTFGRNFETFTLRPAAQIWQKFDTTGAWGDCECANNRDTWNYQLNSQSVNFKALGTDILRVRAFSIGGSGLTVKIAQIVFLPAARFNDSSYPSEDFESLEYPTSWDFGNNMPSDDNEPDGLGLYTVDRGQIWQDTAMALADFQDGSGVEFDQENIHPYNEEKFSDWEVPTWMYYLRGTMAFPSKSVYNEAFGDFSTFFGSLSGGVGFVLFPRSSYGYVLNNFYGFSQGASTPGAWDAGHAFDGGLQNPGSVGCSGGVFQAALGGLNTQLTVAKVTLGTNFKNPSGAGQVPIPVTGETPPTFQHMHNWIIEGMFSWNHHNDATDSAGADVGEIGTYSANQLTFSGGHNITTGISLILNENLAGTLTARLVQRNGSTTEHVLWSGTFDTSYTLNRHVCMKMRKREYNIDIKIWYEDAGEPSSWTQSLHFDLTETHGFTTNYIAYPYYPNTPTFSTQWNNLFSRAYEDFFYFQSAVNNAQAIPSYSGGQSQNIVFSWYYFKISYDPDGNTNVDTHTTLVDERTSTAIATSTAPSTRDCIFYGGLRTWSVLDGSFSSGYSGFKSYDYLDSGAGNLVAAASGYYMWRRPRVLSAIVNYVLASLYNRVRIGA